MGKLHRAIAVGFVSLAFGCAGADGSGTGDGWDTGEGDVIERTTGAVSSCSTEPFTTDMSQLGQCCCVNDQCGVYRPHPLFPKRLLICTF